MHECAAHRLVQDVIQRCPTFLVAGHAGRGSEFDGTERHSVERKEADDSAVLLQVLLVTLPDVQRRILLASRGVRRDTCAQERRFWVALFESFECLLDSLGYRHLVSAS